MRYHLAIDFGTTYSVVVYRSIGLPEFELFTSPGLSDPGMDSRLPLIPSILYVKNGQTGEAIPG